MRTDGPRPAWTPARGSRRVSLSTWGPFVTHELVRRPDGGTELYTARRHRKGTGPVAVGPHDDVVAAARLPRVRWAPQVLGWWIAVLFMIGSALFAVASAPGVPYVVSAAVVGGTFFAGSIFFTSAAYLQFVQTINAGPGRHTWLVAWQPASIGWWSATVQLAGTLWFNLNTFGALQAGLTVRQTDLRVWTPDMIGSVCFLVASWLAVEEVRAPRRGHRWRDVAWRIVWINFVGSVFFMISALAAFVRPATGDPVGATVANGGTFLGALCFFWGARLLLVELAEARPREPAGA